MSIAKHIPAHIKAVSRSIGFALWIGTRDQWFGLSLILRAQLSDEQRAALAFQALKSLDYDLACFTADMALNPTSEQREAA